MPVLLYLLCAIAVIATGAVISNGQAETSQTLKPASAFAAITNKRERSIAIFMEAGKVLQHPRCLNCHPAGNRPSQGNDGHPHLPLVTRGEDGFGVIGMRCITCHGQANFEPGGVPGRPGWHLAPIQMAWQGKSLSEICVQIKDRNRNGGKSMEDLVHHMGEDPLVGWAWAPGADRKPPPGSQKQLQELIKAWVETGGACPSP